MASREKQESDNNPKRVSGLKQGLNRSWEVRHKTGAKPEKQGRAIVLAMCLVAWDVTPGLIRPSPARGDHRDVAQNLENAEGDLRSS